ncbi:MAG: TetR/AcrR family transcriptional regulator [Cyclobacteriaceae bacterium]|nr:TetR/AcrR family transcriptional regulator [Cyclobacteriaceae bacterium HetDA_MAG_MS6]
MKITEEPWVITGYKVFAEKGPLAISVEGLARTVNKNKSSFYHHFVDLEIFISRLLNYHLERSEIILDEEKKCENINPDLFKVIMKYRRDVLFHRQLLIHRNNPNFDDLYTKITEQGITNILEIWNKELGLSTSSSRGKRLLKLGIESLFQRASSQNFTLIFLECSFNELKAIAVELKNFHKMDGTV